MRNGIMQPESRRAFFIDNFLIFITLTLVTFGIVMVYSATGVMSQEKYGDAFYFVKRQAIAACLGIVLLVVCSYIKIPHLRKYSTAFLVLGVLMLIATLIPGLGFRAGGAHRWLKLGSLRFEPGELAKVFFVIFMAGFLARHESVLSKFSQGFVKPVIFLALIAGIFLLQPDFGSVVVISIVTMCMVLVSGARVRYMFLAALAFLLFAAAMIWISPYRMSRILAFLSPFSDASGKGYQLIQSLIAVGSGQVTGVGLGESKQKLFYLPAAHTDFIFAVVAEELGFLGCIFLIVLFVGLVWRGAVWAIRFSDDTFMFALASGITCLLGIEALLNIGVVLGLLPTKGMVLPLVGYGGSNLISSLMAIGLLLGVAREFNRRA